MKRTVKAVILGALLQGSAHAGEQSATAKPSLSKGQNKVAVAQLDQPTGKKGKIARKKANPVATADRSKTSPESVKEKQGEVTGAPADVPEQSVQIKGVRG